MNQNLRQLNLDEEVVALENLVELLRGPDGCPWDAKQTFQTVRLYLLEEAYEVIDAIDNCDQADICAELGDLLFQIFFLASIAKENGQFNMSDVVSGIKEKMIRRHPHVFSDIKVDGADQVVRNWNEIKKTEYKIKNKIKNKKQCDIFAGLSETYPALMKTDKILSKAKDVNFSYEMPDNIKKVLAPFTDIKAADVKTEESESFENEMGKLIFAIVALCKDRKVSAEDILRKTNVNFMDEVCRGHQLKKRAIEKEDD